MTKPKTPTEEQFAELHRKFFLKDGYLCYARNTRSNSRIILMGERVGDGQSRKYIKTNILKREFAAHRITYYLHHKVWPGDLQVDHIDGNTRNNHIDNLRLLTFTENMSSYRSVYGASKYRGVSRGKNGNGWRTQINNHKVKYYLGTFPTEEEAALAFNIKALELGFNKEAFNKVFDY